MTVFPDEFITRVKQSFPDNKDGLHDALLDPNPAYALTLLMRYSTQDISPELIVSLLEKGKSEELLNQARHCLASLDLYNEAMRYASGLQHPWQSPR